MGDPESANEHRPANLAASGGKPAGALGPYRTRANDFETFREPRWKRWCIVVFGILAPVAVLAIELAEGLCKGVLFDPLPSRIHVFLVALVPVANAVALSWHAARFPWVQRALNGAALVVTGVYALVFLPLMPLSFIAVIFYGLGLLSLSPAFALGATLVALSLLKGRAALDPAPRFYPRLAGALAAAALFIAALLPHLLTQHGLQLATSPDPETAQKGRAFLRRFSSTDRLLAACSRNLGRQTSSPLMLGFLFDDRVSAEQAGEIFYRVTGNVCSTRADEFDGGFRTRTFATVAQDPKGPDRSADVQLASSRFDATVDANAAVGYLEWTLVLKNVSGLQQEAVAELELPKDSVISRATLWIDGEPREAAFASRSRVKEAYERVVSRRKDPLLVTSTGRGHVQLRCFPVPPRGEMKILVGITAPLAIESPSVGLLGLPTLLHANFSREAQHQLWVESKQPFQLDGTRARAIKTGFSLDQALSAQALEPAKSLLRFERNPAKSEAWSPDPIDGQHVIKQRIEPYQKPAIEHVSLVVDASLRQKPTVDELRAALPGFPAGSKLLLLTARDDQRFPLNPAPRAEAALSKELDDVLSRLSFEGGADNVPALTHAIEEASRRSNAAVLWIHGPQPYLFEQPERVRQVLERAGGRVTLLHLQTTPGRYRVVEALEDAPGFTKPANRGDLAATLRHQFKEWSGASLFRAIRERQARPEGASEPAGLKTSEHLARLWAYEEVERLAAEGNRAQALKLAGSHELVTSISGAVVLETAAQYAEAGLVPPTGENVPSVPEPAFWALVGCALGFLLLMYFHARRLKQSEPACS
jgi:hypothetical protein